MDHAPGERTSPGRGDLMEFLLRREGLVIRLGKICARAWSLRLNLWSPLIGRLPRGRLRGMLEIHMK